MFEDLLALLASTQRPAPLRRSAAAQLPELRQIRVHAVAGAQECDDRRGLGKLLSADDFHGLLPPQW